MGGVGLSSGVAADAEAVAEADAERLVGDAAGEPVGLRVAARCLSAESTLAGDSAAADRAQLVGRTVGASTMKRSESEAQSPNA